MRQSLGLPLLSETVETPAQSAERTAVENARAQQRQQAKEREDDELKQRLSRHREERLYKKQLQGVSLAEEIMLEQDKAAASAADWVAQSRSRQQQRQKEVRMNNTEWHMTHCHFINIPFYLLQNYSSMCHFT